MARGYNRPAVFEIKSAGGSGGRAKDGKRHGENATKDV
jgi:hypothetical protein